MTASIVRVTRGDAVEVYRIALLDDGSATLERFENGGFGPARLFRGWAAVEPGGLRRREPARLDARLDQAIRHISRYLDGAVTVGERDLLSPASAMTRNVRWFPGDLQMLETSAAYVRELFPSAQFHITQLLRRVFGDAAFVALIVLTSLFWLRVGSPAPLRGLAVALLVVSMIAIVGIDGYVQPIRLAWQRRRLVSWRGRGPRAIYELPLVVLGGLCRGTWAIAQNTLIGLANLVINPQKILQSHRSLRRGKSLEWKASSVSAGQDVRGWPLAEFTDTYGGPLRLGLGLLAFLVWLVALGAPLGILGLSGLGVFVASFLTAALYAWYSALPRRLSDGAPGYAIPRAELATLALAGLVGVALSMLLWRLGVYPLPAFEGSIAIVAAFLTGSAAFAILYPPHHRLAFATSRGTRRRGQAVRALAWATLGVGCLASCSVYPAPWSSLAALVASPLGRALHRDEAAWRMPEPERRVYEQVQRSMRQHGRADPEPLLRAQGSQVSLKKLASVRMPDLREPHGLPAPRLPRLRLARPRGTAAHELPELQPLPPARRLPMVKPAREFLLPASERKPEAPLAREVGLEQTAATRRRALALTPRALSPDERRAQDELIARADYPWIEREELRRLGRPDALGAATDDTVPLLEIARVERWDDVRELWDRVEAASRGGVPDRVRLHRLREGIEGALAVGGSATPEQVQRFLSEELDLIEDWSRAYPSVPLSSLADGAPPRGRFFELTRFLLEQRLGRAELRDALRLDYVNAYWAAPSAAPALHQVFRDRVRLDPWERLELDWEDNERLRLRWEGLQTEQAVATRIWRAAGGDAPPTPAVLHDIVLFLERVLERLLARASDGPSPYAQLGELFRLEGVDARALESGDAVAALLASRVWTQAMAGRVAQIVSKSAAGVALPGSDADRAIVSETDRLRYPEDGGDPMLRRVLEWLTLVDGAETYAELAAGYDRFVREAQDLGLGLQGLGRAPRLEREQLYRDLIAIWREVPGRFPAIPVRHDMVAEFLCHTAYFSSRDGRTPRTPGELLDDFARQLSAVDARMADAPPEAIQRLADRHFERIQGRVSRSAAARRFFAWWMVAVQAEVIEHNLERRNLEPTRGLSRGLDLPTVARDWAGLLELGAERYPHLPWLRPGFTEYFLNVQRSLGTSREQLMGELDGQLAGANGLVARHVVPFRTFEAVVDRRIQEQTGSVNFDPALRRANALVALAELCHVLAANGLGAACENPARVTEAFSLLYEKLARDYPLLHWDSDGLIELYLLTQLRQGWDLEQTVQRFDADWSLAQTLAAHGLLARLDAEDPSLAPFMRAQVARLEEKTGARIRKSRTRAMSALLALSSLVQSAAEEGLLPEQRGLPWSKAIVRAWASALVPGSLDTTTLGWIEGLTRDWVTLLEAMRAAGPAFPWHAGATLEANLLAMRSAGASVADMSAGLGATWRTASELIEHGPALPPAAFRDMVQSDAATRLRARLALARGVSPAAIPAAELEPEDPAQPRLDAVLALADVVAAVRLQHQQPGPQEPVSLQPLALQDTAGPDRAALVTLAEHVSDQIVELRRAGPLRYPFLPWAERGFVPSLVVAAHGADLAGDFWKYADLVHLRESDALLGELAARRAAGAPPLGAGALPEGLLSDGLLPEELLADVRAGLLRETGRTPASERLVELSAVRDGELLLRELVPEARVTLDHVITITRLRARLRALGERYSELGIVRAEDSSVRTGFAERLAALAMKRALEAGLDPRELGFVDRAVALVEEQFLGRMQRIYAAVRASLPAEELEHHQVLIADEARADNPARAARHGLSADRLGVPEVRAEDIVADAALYEVLYAKEIGQGDRYLSTLFDIFGKIQRRPAMQSAFRSGLARVDAPYQPLIERPGAPGYALWRTSSAHRRWWRKRGDFIRSARGRIIGLSRTLALVKSAAFEPEGDPAARASFARFGDFDAYLEQVMGAYDRVAAVPELATALGELQAEDPYLSDGVQFALALLSCHVLGRVYPEPGQAERALAELGAALPRVLRDQRQVLGFTPRLESGVPLYDARQLMLREQIEPGPGSRLLYRLELLQRGVQRWSQAHLLQQAYRVLFFRDLDPDDPTRVAGSGVPALLRGRHASLEALVARAFDHSQGERAAEFLERRLPAQLAARTGTQDLGVWIAWLMQHGELDLDGEPTGENPYAAEVRQYEERLAHYRQLVASGERAGRSVRAEQQRVQDIEKEYASFRRQVATLRASADSHAMRVGSARRHYEEAMIWHAFLPLALILLVHRAVRACARRLGRGPRRRAALTALGLWLPLAAAVGVPCWVARSPERAAQLGERGLSALLLLGRDPAGQLEPRGAAAQLARSSPWQLLESTR